MFNSFFTFSAADLHWDELHNLLPGHEKYLGKRIVKNLDEVEESKEVGILCFSTYSSIYDPP